MTRFFSLLLLLLLGTGLSAQQNGAEQPTRPKHPESVAWQPATGEFYLSDPGTKTIWKGYGEGAWTPIRTGLNTPLGILATEAGLWVTDSCFLRLLDFNSGAEIKVITITGALQLNGIDQDEKGMLYVSDRLGDKIWAIDPTEQSAPRLLNDDIHIPNGILVESGAGSLLVCTTVDSAAVWRVPLQGGKAEKVLQSTYAYFDGITKDREGHYYLSSWGPKWKFNRILKYKPDWKGEPEAIHESDEGPADIRIFYQQGRGFLAVPLYWRGDFGALPVPAAKAASEGK